MRIGRQKIFEANKHPKYGAEPAQRRRGNGWRRSKTRQHKLECSVRNTSTQFWTTGVFFDEDKNRLVWFSNLWHRKFWRITFNRRIRHIKNIPDYNFYRKIFYLILNCDMVSLGYHGEMKPERKLKLKNPSEIHSNKKIRPHQLRWFKMYGQ